MSRSMLFGLVILALGIVFAPLIFGGQQLGFRDASHFYYPFYRAVHQQLASGTVPLWNPLENGGQPLAGNGTSAAFYPGKLLFLVLPYPLAFKWFHILHVVLALLATYTVARWWGLDRSASTVAGLTYGLSGYVLSQLCNAPFLISAAWLPWALWAVDVLVRGLGTGWGRPTLILAAALALPVLGGDPQLSYMVGFFAVPYAAVWHAAAGQWRGLGAATSRLALAGLLAGLLAAVQLLLTADLVQVSSRAAPAGPKNNVDFSYHPVRTVEFFLPTFFGRALPQNGNWFPYPKIDGRMWAPSVYTGCLTTLLACLALVGARPRSEPGVAPSATAAAETDGCARLPRRGLAALLIASLLIAFGRYTGPQWLINAARANDPNDLMSDGIYWLLETCAPGFALFRFPAKLLVFTSLALALLAGAGFARLARQPSRRLGRNAAIGGAALILMAAAVWTQSTAFANWIDRPEMYNVSMGKVQPDRAVRDLLAALIQPGLLLLAAGGLLRWQPTRWATVGLLLIAVDLVAANAWLVLPVPQELYDHKPPLVAKLEADRQSRPPLNAGIPLPPRIHRTPLFSPRWLSQTSSPGRIAELVALESQSLQPKYGNLWQLAYVWTYDTLNIYDTIFFFAPWYAQTPVELLQQQPKAPTQIVVFPKTGYDLWATEYFVLPNALVLTDEYRGTLTLRLDRFGRPLPVIHESPPEAQDVLVVRNPNAMPRARVVHTLDSRPVVRSLDRNIRRLLMEDLLYRTHDAGLALWPPRNGLEYPHESKAMVEYEGDLDLRQYISGMPTTPAETPIWEADEPDYLRLKVTMESPGMLVVADTYDPGWQVTVDGEPTPLLRANRAMRGVVLPSGSHVVEMRYVSWLFRISGVVSLATWLVAALCWRRLSPTPPLPADSRCPS